MNDMKKISGTWFEFCHHNEAEGRYWNEACRSFTREQWEEKVDEIASLGMKYIVLMSTSLVYKDRSESYFNNDIFPFADMACSDPMEALFASADRNDIKVFVSCGFYGIWNRTSENITSSEVTDRAFRAMRLVYEQYGSHKSFYGWYLPDETCIVRRFGKKFIEYVNRYASEARRIFPGSRVLIAPYGTLTVRADRKYIEQLKALDADIVAYQDEVGVKKTVPFFTRRKFRALRRAHNEPGTPELWADVELFTFEKQVYRSALIPADFNRIRRQLEAVSPYADEVLCYQYQGLFNRPGTSAFCGHPDSYKSYKELLDYNGDFASGGNQ